MYVYIFLHFPFTQAVNKNVADLAGRARKGKLAPEEYNGGSFTISNLGMFGIKEFTAVINPPQACILAVGGGAPMATVGKNNDLEKDTVMTVVLSADRRVVDDHIAAQFLQVFKTYCEHPSLMSVQKVLRKLKGIIVLLYYCIIDLLYYLLY